MTSIVRFLLWLTVLQGIPNARLTAAPGPGFIRGIIEPSAADEPLPFVRLTLIPINPPGNAEISSTTTREIQATSGREGVFLFAAPPGQYFITADRQYYVHQEFYRPGPGMSTDEKPLIVLSGQIIQIRLELDPDPIVTGKIYGPLGQPLSAAVVQAYQLRYTPYGRELSLAATELSQEDGRYRLFHLDPGFYIVSASFNRTALQPWQSILDFSPNASNPDDGYATMYYPGALRTVDAKPQNLLTVRGAENVDFALKETHYFTLKVKLLLPQPTARPMLNARVAILPIGSDISSAANYPAIGRDTDFSANHLPEGDYLLVALADFIGADDKRSTAVISDTLPIRLSENTESTIAAVYPMDLPGRLSLEPSATLPAGLGIRLVRVDHNSKQQISVDVDSEGHFILQDVGPGNYDVYLSAMPQDAFLQDVRLSNTDRQFGQIRIDAKQPEHFLDEASGRWASILPLNILVSLMSGTAAGHVTDASGKPFPEAQVVFVPTSTEARLRTDRYFTAVAHAGAFQIPGIPPGQYMAYAFQRLEHEIYYDSDFNARVASRGVTVDIAPGPQRKLDLTVITTNEMASLLQ